VTSSSGPEIDGAVRGSACTSSHFRVRTGRYARTPVGGQDREEEAISVNLLVDNRAVLVTGSLAGDCGVRAGDRELIGLGQEVA
jgi:hypothetical protein